MSVESSTVVKPLNIVPHIRFGSMRDCDDNLASRNDIVDEIGSRIVIIFENLLATRWNSALTVYNNWFHFITNASGTPSRLLICSHLTSWSGFAASLRCCGIFAAHLCFILIVSNLILI